MSRNGYLGEFEQMLLLAILQGGRDANAFEIRRELEQSAGRTVSKGGFYTTLDRMERKGLLTWEARTASGERGGHPQRHFEVTPAGVAALRKSRAALLRLWRGLDGVLSG